jgi:hypothetical protein
MGRPHAPRRQSPVAVQGLLHAAISFEAKLWLAFHLGRICSPAFCHGGILVQSEQFGEFNDMKAYDTLLQKAVDSLAVTFHKRATSGLISSRDFILPNAHEQVHEKTDLELVTWLVIKEDK